jgi:micrococcal nuclease
VRKFLETAIGYIIVIGIIATIVAVILYVQRPPKNPGKYAELIDKNVLYKVVKVLDGDTLVANVKGHEVAVRLIGMDTPEVVDPRKPVQCYGPEASAKAHEILEEKEIYIEKEAAKGNYDKYGRVLAYAHMSDGSLYNEYMITHGFAREYTFNKENYKYQKLFKDAQKMAQKEKVGLWGVCN